MPHVGTFSRAWIRVSTSASLCFLPRFRQAASPHACKYCSSCPRCQSHPSITGRAPFLHRSTLSSSLSRCPRHEGFHTAASVSDSFGVHPFLADCVVDASELLTTRPLTHSSPQRQSAQNTVRGHPHFICYSITRDVHAGSTCGPLQVSAHNSRFRLACLKPDQSPFRRYSRAPECSIHVLLSTGCRSGK